MRYWPSLFSQDGLIWPRSFLRFYWPRRNYYMATKRIFSCGTNAGYPKWVRWARVANQSVGFASSYPLADSAIHYQAIIGWSRVWCEELCGSSRVLTTEADNTLRDWSNWSYHTKAKSNNCFIIIDSKYIKPSQQNMLTSIYATFPSS